MRGTATPIQATTRQVTLFFYYLVDVSQIKAGKEHQHYNADFRRKRNKISLSDYSKTRGPYKDSRKKSSYYSRHADLFCQIAEQLG